MTKVQLFDAARFAADEDYIHRECRSKAAVLGVYPTGA
jgi:hypothetical protein